MERGFEYNLAVRTEEERLKESSDELVFSMAIYELLKPIETLSNRPHITALLNEITVRVGRRLLKIKEMRIKVGG